MEIKINSDTDFQELLVALAQEVVDVNINWRLLTDLEAEYESFSTEYQQSMTFWTRTFRALLHSTVFGLMRVFDGNSKSLSLSNLLDTIAANMGIFDEDQFRERLSENRFVESLAAEARKPEEKQLEKDIAFSSENNEIVKKLTIWRNNLFAHRNANNVISGKDISSDYPLDYDEIDVLVNGSMEILNRYSSLFGAATYSPKITGHDDYKFVLESVRHKLDSLEKEFESDLARIRKANPGAKL